MLKEISTKKVKNGVKVLKITEETMTIDQIKQRKAQLEYQNSHLKSKVESFKKQYETNLSEIAKYDEILNGLEPEKLPEI